MQFFHIFGLKIWKNIFLINKTIKGRNDHQGASFEPLTATIGPTGRPVARRMKPKKEKNRRRRVIISRMRRHAPFEPTNPNTCMWGGVPDAINCAIFLKIGQGVSELAYPEKRHFPIFMFWAPNFQRRDPKCLTQFIKLHSFPNMWMMWESLVTVCRRTFEITRRKKKNEIKAAKHNTSDTDTPNNTER